MKGKVVSGLMLSLLFIGTLSLVLNVARCMSAPEELLSLPAGATNFENGRDSETMLLSVDVDSETLGDQQEVTVSLGGTIDVAVTFQVWSSGGPGIIKQAFFIYSWTPSWPPPSTHYEPLYNGLPGYHPGVTQTSSFSLTVPGEAGTYYLWFSSGAHYSMEQAVNKYTTPLTLPAHAKIVIGELYSLPAGAKHWVPSDTNLDDTKLLVDVNLAGQGQIAQVSPGETVTGSATYHIWTHNPSEINQGFFVLSWTPSWPAPEGYYIPLWNGISGTYPGTGEVTESFSFTAPSTPGTYYLYWCRQAHYTMRQAVDTYDQPLTLPAHAQIIVAHAHTNIGEWTSDGRIELCVHSFHTSPSIDYYPYAPSTGCIFAWVDLSIRNVGTEDVSTNSLYGYLRDTDNYVYGEEGTLAPKRLALIDLPPGETIRGEIYFEVPTEAVIDDFLWIDLQSDMSVIIPEFPSTLILTLFMIATLLAVIFYRRKHSV